ncbi:MAG TPA: biotin-dependent carboxyltransferase family protein [Nocardioides sp.]|nr:biotin-dependent carboxyltransferase family protein [Nocardioides sp.]
MTTLTVVDPGPLALVQDRGRTGYADLGVGRSGAADLPAMELANRLVGNPHDAAVVEITLGGLRLVADAPAWIAVTGAPVPVRVGVRARWSGEPVPVPAGECVELGLATQGLRCYLAVRGGIEVAPVLGSRSTDLLSGLGPAPLTAGSTLPVGTPYPSWRPVDTAPGAPPPAVDQDLHLPLVLGPRDDWFEPEARSLLLGSRFEVTPDSDRVGLRIAGPTLPRRVTRELSSEGVVRGSVQVPPGGRPTIFGPDHPVTGGYPVIGVVPSCAVHLTAQLRPGQGIRFHERASDNRTPD